MVANPSYYTPLTTLERFSSSWITCFIYLVWQKARRFSPSDILEVLRAPSWRWNVQVLSPPGQNVKTQLKWGDQRRQIDAGTIGNSAGWLEPNGHLAADIHILHYAMSFATQEDEQQAEVKNTGGKKLMVCLLSLCLPVESSVDSPHAFVERE